jgi:hypothetical protein
VLGFPLGKNRNMPKLAIPLQIFLLALSLGGCKDHGGASTVDSWARARAPGLDFGKGNQLDDSRIHQVPEAMETGAEALLVDVSCIELTAEQAEKTLGRKLPEIPGTKPYLTRGVYLNRGTGHFRVTMLDDNLGVFHGSLGHHAVPMKRQALVLQLERIPKEVYVSCHMAE